jgi:hypothetical protein
MRRVWIGYAVRNIQMWLVSSLLASGCATGGIAVNADVPDRVARYVGGSKGAVLLPERAVAGLPMSRLTRALIRSF